MPTAQQVCGEVAELSEHHFLTGLRKLALPRDVSPDNESQATEVIQSLGESQKSSGEKGVFEISDDVSHEVNIFCLLMDTLQIRIDRETSETGGVAETPEADE